MRKRNDYKNAEDVNIFRKRVGFDLIDLVYTPKTLMINFVRVFFVIMVLNYDTGAK